MTLDDLAALARAATPGRRTVEEDDEYWELYAGRGVDRHGYKLIKAAKADHPDVECYWPAAADSAFVEACSPEVIAALVAVAQAAEPIARSDEHCGQDDLDAALATLKEVMSR